MALWQGIAVGIIPSIAVAVLFWYVMRAVIRADRNERSELARIDREDAAASATPPSDNSAQQ